jgi:1-acyl-sn-glycerol-3-phosphate acyltransferase
MEECLVMPSLLRYIFLLFIKYLSKLFYSYEIQWPKGDREVRWKDVKLLVLLNHTSLYEFLYLAILPNSFLRKLSRRMVVPAADKTMNRPVVGAFFKMFAPGMVSITRKRDDSWSNFLESIYEDSVILIAPEGRMMRKTGLDLEGHKMTVRGGVADILEGLSKGQMVIAYSGGLHHVQIPGENFPRLFKTLKMNIETYEIPEYKALFKEPVGTEAWKKEVLDDMQYRLETKPPVF